MTTSQRAVSLCSLLPPFLTLGLRDLQHLSLGWCRNLGAVACDPSNSIQALACLTRLTHLNLGGTQVCDAQLRLVLPHLKVLQVREGHGRRTELADRGLHCGDSSSVGLEVFISEIGGCLSLLLSTDPRPGPRSVGVLTDCLAAGWDVMVRVKCTAHGHKLLSALCLWPCAVTAPHPRAIGTGQT
jgi:hypothetical protein